MIGEYRPPTLTHDKLMSQVKERGFTGWQEEKTPAPCQNDKTDPVNHPAHYQVGGIEVLDYIKAKLTPEQFAGYLLGNVHKYTARYAHKDGKKDLKKARFYLDRLIDADLNEPHP